MVIFNEKKALFIEVFTILMCLFALELVYLKIEVDNSTFLTGLIYYILFTVLLIVVELLRFYKMKNESFAISQTFGTLNLYQRIHDHEMDYRRLKLVSVRYFVSIAYKRFALRFIFMEYFIFVLSVFFILYQIYFGSCIILVISPLPLLLLFENLTNNDIDNFLEKIKEELKKEEESK